ncbi:limonene-1,2-epoxide hydrolase family protein [Aldersonia kunmingensis]|uniref:limonene-1,2-epoxide hydrolase family protein n=1 Tax=Aldersonia kunmingensis TaxID=408066 RepID=UPI000837A218|nr:limonene-1,2-epoxide hydrolase family protein [Aldersonia kunmingensis]
MSESVDLPQDSITVVREFLHALEMGEIDEALELVDPDLVWRNTGWPVIRGRERVRWLLTRQFALQVQLSARITHIAEDVGSVLVERIDDLRFRRIEASFFVWARFDIVDGRIVGWHDRYSIGSVLVNVVIGAARSLLKPRR